jgi:hypothetical protein
MDPTPCQKAKCSGLLFGKQGRSLQPIKGETAPCGHGRQGLSQSGKKKELVEQGSPTLTKIWKF